MGKLLILLDIIWWGRAIWFHQQIHDQVDLDVLRQLIFSVFPDCAFYVLLKWRSQAALPCHLPADWMCSAVVFCSRVGSLKMWGWVSCLRQRAGDYFIASRRLPPPGSVWEVSVSSGPFSCQPTNHSFPSSNIPFVTWLTLQSNVWRSELVLLFRVWPLRPPTARVRVCRPFRHVSSCKLEDRSRGRQWKHIRTSLPCICRPCLKHAMTLVGLYILVVHFLMVCVHPFTHTFIWAQSFRPTLFYLAGPALFIFV